MVTVPAPAATAAVLRLRTILVLAFVLRLAWMLAVPIDPISDSVVYDIFAQRLAAGQGYTWPDGMPTVYWPVGASALYAAVYAIFGHSFAAIGALNLIMGTLLVAAIYALARTRFSAQVASLAALIAALWPGWIQFTTILSGELPSTLLLVAGMIAILSDRRPCLIYVALGALCLVGASYVRPTSLPLIVAVPFFGILLTRGWRPALVGTVLAIVVAAVAIAPWAARNQALFDKPVLVSANFGANLWMGNNPQSDGSYMELPDGLPKNEVERDSLLAQQAIGFIRDNPVRFLQFSLHRVVDSFGRETIGVAWNENALPEPVVTPLKLISSLYWLVAFALSVVGVAAFLWERPVRLFDPLVFSPALFAAIAIFIVGGDRYHFGMMPFVAIFGAHAISKGLAAFRPARNPSAQAA